jgi:hypothetical protein
MRIAAGIFLALVSVLVSAQQPAVQPADALNKLSFM